MQKSARKKIFYGWRIAAAAAAMQFMQNGLVYYSFGAYLAVLSEAFGWSKTALAGAASMQQVEGALLGPIQGWIVDRFGPRGMVHVGVCLLAAGLMLLSSIDSLLGFYGAFFLIALGMSLSGFFPMSVTIINWFEKKRARALSLMHLGLAGAGMAVPAVAWCLQTFGWRPTAFASGLIVLAAGFPIARVVRHRPEDLGEVVDGEPRPAADAAHERRTSPGRDFTTREAIGTPAFWLIAIGHGLALCAVGAVNVHAIVHMKESLGYSVSTAAFVMSMLLACYAAGTVLGGVLGDRWDKRLVCALCMLLHLAGVLLLTFASSLAMLIAFALTHGIGWGWRGPIMNAIRADYFGRRAIGMIIGLSAVITVIFSATGPIIAGMFADALGDYRTGFTVIGMLVGVGSLSFLFARRPSPPVRQGAGSFAGGRWSGRE